MSERQHYIDKIQARLDQWNAEIEKLQAKSREAEADSKIDHQKQIETLRERRDAAEQKIGDVRNASDDAWQDAKAGLDKAVDDLSSAFDKAKSRFQ